MAISAVLESKSSSPIGRRTLPDTDAINLYDGGAVREAVGTTDDVSVR